MAHKFSKGMAEIIKRRTGLTPEQISGMNHDEVRERIEAHTGHKITKFGLEPSAISSGNIMIDLGRVITREEIDAEIAKV